MIIFSTTLVAQDAYFTLTGHRQDVVGPDTFHVADVQTHSNAGFKLGSGQLYFNYNTSTFGSNIFTNGALNISIPSNSILDKKIIAPPFTFNIYGDFITNDNTSDRVSFSWQHDFSHACFDTANVTYYSDVLFTIRLKYLPGETNSDHGLCLESAESYIHQTFTACGPDPCNTSDCFNFPGVQILNDTLPCSDCLLVYTTEDDGSGSLRNAINCATNGDTIRFAYSLFSDSIELTTQNLIMDKDIQILAKKQFNITVDGSGVMRVFRINTGKNVEISGLKLIEGNGIEGTGILNEGNLILKDITVYKRQNSTSVSQILNNSFLQIEGDVSIKNP